MAGDAIETVFEAWLERQKAPERCVLTPIRRKQIKAALGQGYKPEHLIALIRYAYESEAPGPRYWRGQNATGAKYLDIENLTRVGKLAGRIEAALTWLEEGDEVEDEDDSGGNVISMIRRLDDQQRGDTPVRGGGLPRRKT